MALIVLVSVAVPARAESAALLLQKAAYQEETVGDVDAAIEIYEQIISAAEAARRSYLSVSQSSVNAAKVIFP